MRYILGVVALLEACDATDNGLHLGFCELEILLKRREMVIFVLYMKNDTRFTFIVERS